MAQAREVVQQGVPRTEALRNFNHNLISSLDEKLDGVWRYDKYIEDARAAGCDSCAQLFQRLKEEDVRHIEMLRSELEEHCKRGDFH